MFEIAKKQILNSSVTRMDIKAPLIANKALPGQFVMLRVDKDGERIPLTIADHDKDAGTVTIIFQVMGSSTQKLNAKSQGDYIEDFVGPLGKHTDTDNIKKACIIGGGVGSAIAYPIARKLKESGAQVHSIVGFRNKELVILEDMFRDISDKFVLMTDDGSHGKKGLVTDALKELIESGEKYDEVFAVGPLVMMKFVSLVTKEHNIKTTVSMNPIMVDGTGMCGGCRLTVGGKIKFACVDGPDFDGHQVDFDEVIDRNTVYKKREKTTAREENCRLYPEEKQ